MRHAGAGSRVALLVVVVAAIAAGPASAQTVVGQVVEAETLKPLAGTFVVLEDEAGDRHRGVLADGEGRFVLRAVPGTYRLVTELIGYASTRTAPVTLVAGETVRRTLEVPVQAVSLEGIQVETGARCRRRPGSGPATARLWEEARKALEVASWSERERALQFSVVRHRRELDARTLEVMAQTTRPSRAWYDRSPYRSIPAARLEAGGYIQRAGDDTWDYYAPDADVLLSESFLSSHCFRVAGSGEDPELVGLGFEPVPERTQPDIEGVLWIARGTGELRRLDFRYVNAPTPFGDHPGVGGRVEFERLATGMWLVRRWRIRMPLAARRTGGYGGSSRELALLTLAEDGAEVRSARTRDGRELAAASGATLYGLAVRGPDGGPLADAEVMVPALGHVARTGEDGAYRLLGLDAGRFAVTVRHPDLELLGVGPLRLDATLEAGRATRLPIDAGLTRALAVDRCRTPAGAVSPAVVFGRVTDAGTGVPVARAVIRFDAGAGESLALADSAGAYLLCLDPGARVRLGAAPPGAAADPLRAPRPVAVTAPASGFLRQDLTLERGAPSSGARTGSVWRNALMGTVLEEGTGAPIAAATVTLFHADGSVAGRAISDDRGRFTVPHPGRGDAFDISVERIGYAPSRDRVPFRSAQEVRVEVTLSTRAVELDPIVVTGRRHGLLVDVGFYDRLETGAGEFVTREAIERQRPVRTTDLFRRMAGMKVVPVGGGQRDVRIVGQSTLRSMVRECQPKVVVDGVVARPGGKMKMLGTQPDPGDLLDQLVAPDAIEAMEVYAHPSQVPLRYGGTDASCGVVVIWTRRGGP